MSVVGYLDFKFWGVECVSAISLVYGIMCVFYSCMFCSRIIIDCFMQQQKVRNTFLKGRHKKSITTPTTLII